MRPFRPQFVRSLRPAARLVRSFPTHTPLPPPPGALPVGRVRWNQHAAFEHLETQQVHVSRPWLTRKRIGYWLFVTSGSWLMFVLFVRKLAEALDVDLEEAELEETQSEEDDEALFIPCSIPQKLPKTFYRQSDPDWQEFVRVSNDEKRSSAVREELAQRCLRDVAAAPKMQQLLGSNVQLGSYWLDIKYPDSPPPEYSRQGIEIADDYVAWAEQTIPHEHYVKLRHLMYPTAMFAAVQNSVKIFGHLQWIKVKNGLGIQLSQTDKQVSAISKIEKGRMQIESMQAKLESQDEAGSAERQRLLDRLNKSESGNAADQKPPALPKPKETDPPSSAISHPLLSFFLPTGAGSQSDDSESGSARRTLTPFKPNSDMMLAWKMFIQTLQITWRKSRLDMQPKGAFFVVGQVEVRGDRGRIRCDLHAAYNPKESKVVFCICQVKHFWEWRQRARGGP